MASIVLTVVPEVLAGIVYNNRRIDDVSRRFDDVNRRFDDVHRRIDDLRADMNARFARVDARLSELREDLREIRTLLQEALRARGLKPARSSPSRSRKRSLRSGPAHRPSAPSGLSWPGQGACCGWRRDRARASGFKNPERCTTITRKMLARVSAVQNRCGPTGVKTRTPF
ncbi:MAG: hypothetical protein ACK45F_08450 [bacterium]